MSTVPRPVSLDTTRIEETCARKGATHDTGADRHTLTLRPLCLHRSVIIRKSFATLSREVSHTAIQAAKHIPCKRSAVPPICTPSPTGALTLSAQRCTVSSKRRVPGLSTRADPNPPSRGPCSACPLCAHCKPDFGIHPRRMRPLSL